MILTLQTSKIRAIKVYKWNINTAITYLYLAEGYFDSDSLFSCCLQLCKSNFCFKIIWTSEGKLSYGKNSIHRVDQTKNSNYRAFPISELWFSDLQLYLRCSFHTHTKVLVICLKTHRLHTNNPTHLLRYHILRWKFIQWVSKDSKIQFTKATSNIKFSSSPCWLSQLSRNVSFGYEYWTPFCG